MLTRLLAKGDHIELKRGLLVITPKSGDPVPTDWIKSKQAEIIKSISELTNQSLFSYQNYDTGSYMRGIATGGLSLQFINLKDDTEAYAVFNAELSHQRTTKYHKKGSPLPKRQFYTTQRSKFFKFWKSTNLPIPVSLTRFNQSMGKLKQFVFEGHYHENAQGRLTKDNLKPANITYDVLFKLFKSHNDHIITTQGSHNYHIAGSHKETPPAQAAHGLELHSKYGGNEVRKKVIRESGNKDQSKKDISNINTTSTSTPNNPKRVEDQSLDEWFDGYNAANHC
jgi:hypothetical protein